MTTDNSDLTPAAEASCAASRQQLPSGAVKAVTPAKTDSPCGSARVVAGENGLSLPVRGEVVR